MEIKDCSSKEISDDQLKNASGGFDYINCTEPAFKFTSYETDKLRSQGYDIRPARVYTRSALNKILQTNASNLEGMKQILRRKGLGRGAG